MKKLKLQTIAGGPQSRMWRTIDAFRRQAKRAATIRNQRPESSAPTHDEPDLNRIDNLITVQTMFAIKLFSTR